MLLISNNFKRSPFDSESMVVILVTLIVYLISKGRCIDDKFLFFFTTEEQMTKLFKENLTIILEIELPQPLLLHQLLLTRNKASCILEFVMLEYLRTSKDLYIFI
jgi:hypothetical protein